MGVSEAATPTGAEGVGTVGEESLYTEDSYRIEESVGYLLAQLRARLVSAVDAESAGYDITAAQWSTLLYIGNGHCRTAAELCRRTSCDTGSMTRMLDRLEEKGLIRRSRSTEDRRVVNIEFTPAGSELFPKLPSIAIRVLNRHLRGFSRDELEQLKSYLRRMLANAED
ncbi:MAG: MarR family transcriptional regulator [Rhodocyclaceae bacterium]